MSSGVARNPCRDEQRAELAHLVPEDRVVPVLDVEVVALDVREDRPRQPEVLIERRSRLVVGQQRSVLVGDPVALGADRGERAGDVLARLRAARCRPPMIASGTRRVVDPRAVVVVEAVAVRVVEPRRLHGVPVREPLARPPSVSATAPRGAGLVARGGQHRVGHAELERPRGQPLELVVGPEQHDVDPRDHLRDRLVGDVREALLAELVEARGRRRSPG